MGMWLLLLLIKTILLCLQMNNRYFITFLFLMVAFSSLAADAFEVEGVWYEPTSESTVMVVEKPSSGTDGTSIIFRNCYEGDVIRGREGMASGNETAFLVAKHLKRTEVCPVVCNLLNVGKTYGGDVPGLLDRYGHNAICRLSQPVLYHCAS